MKKAFTLIELLVVIAIIAVLAAILFPVFAQAKESGKKAVCLSNLKQLGTAFFMYDGDWDDALPAPITNYGATGGAVPPTWVVGNPAISGTGQLFKDDGGIYPYVKERGDGGANNVFACPDAVATPQGDPVSYSSPPGQNYVMNQYVQGNWGGFYHVSPQTGRNVPTKGADDANGNYTPFTGTMAPDPANLILLFEAAQEDQPGTSFDGSVNRYGTPFYQGFGGSCRSYNNDGTGNVPCLQPTDYHNDVSNFLFMDGHVKSLHPATTWTAATAAIIEANPPTVSGAATPSGPGAGINGVDWYGYKRHLGAGSIDLWNPNIPGSFFP